MLVCPPVCVLIDWVGDGKRSKYFEWSQLSLLLDFVFINVIIPRHKDESWSVLSSPELCCMRFLWDPPIGWCPLSSVFLLLPIHEVKKTTMTDHGMVWIDHEKDGRLRDWWDWERDNKRSQSVIPVKAKWAQIWRKSLHQKWRYTCSSIDSRIAWGGVISPSGRTIKIKIKNEKGTNKWPVIVSVKADNNGLGEKMKLEIIRISYLRHLMPHAVAALRKKFGMKCI